MRIVVLDGFPIDQGEDRWEPLRALGAVELHARTRAALVARRIGDADAALTNKVAIDAALLEACPRLRYVGVTATGVDIVDLAACRARGVAVANVPAYSTESVAQLVFAMLLHLTHRVDRHDRAVREGAWREDFCLLLQPLTELAGLTLATVGTGAIGSAVARIAGAFGMRHVAAAVPGSASPGRMPLPEALAIADVVSLHCPLKPATRGMVDRAFLARMKPGAVLVNTGRGGLVDETALIEALAGGRLGGAALDVLGEEPPPADHPLIRGEAAWRERLVVTPHIGWGTVAARLRLLRESAANLAAYRRGERRNRVD